MLKEWQVDGSYEIAVTRKSDGKKIRSYDLDVVDGEIHKIERSQLGFEPATEFVLPRVIKISATYIDMVEAIWIEDFR